MPVLMGIIRNEHGLCQARRKVLKRLSKAVAQVLGGDRADRAWLKRWGLLALVSPTPRVMTQVQQFERVLVAIGHRLEQDAV